MCLHPRRPGSTECTPPIPSPFGPVLPFKVTRPAGSFFVSRPRRFSLFWQGGSLFCSRPYSFAQEETLRARCYARVPRRLPRCGWNLVIQDNFMPSLPPPFFYSSFFINKFFFHFMSSYSIPWRLFGKIVLADLWPTMPSSLVH